MNTALDSKMNRVESGFAIMLHSYQKSGDWLPTWNQRSWERVFDRGRLSGVECESTLQWGLPSSFIRGADRRRSRPLQI